MTAVPDLTVLIRHCHSTFVEYVVSPALLCRVDTPGWDAFLARLAVTVLSPGLPEPAPPPPVPAAESEAEFLQRLHRMVAGSEAEL
jgi:hypothetical protein